MLGNGEATHHRFVDLSYQDINQNLLQLNGSFAYISTAHDLLGIDHASFVS